MKIKVSVLDEHEIFRRGVVSCLTDDPSIEVLDEDSDVAPDVAVVSPVNLESPSFDCPIVVCAGAYERVRSSDSNGVKAVLPRAQLEPMQLVAAVYAAAAGLTIDGQADALPSEIDGRSIDVLTLLAEGRATNDISKTLGYSERTIKVVIRQLVETLGARNRVQAVAEGIRRGWI